MDSKDFKHSIETDEFPEDAPAWVQALWYDGKGDWNKAHSLIDQLFDVRSAQIHAYLHRKEGDLWNADYWYKRAGKKRPDLGLEEEWLALVRLYTN